jgi:hypothetical protein
VNKEKEKNCRKEIILLILGIRIFMMIWKEFKIKKFKNT